MVDLEDEARKMTDMLRGKNVRVIRRHRSREVVIEFDDGTRLFVNGNADGLDFSVTEMRCTSGTQIGAEPHSGKNKE